MLLLFVLFQPPVLFAQKVIESSTHSAGFRFATDNALSGPVIHYQQNVHMLAVTDDMPSVNIFGDGRVLVHYPVYMKKAGDYEMQLSDEELVDLVQSMSSHGIIDFDENKVKQAIGDEKKSARVKGELYTISDTVETSIVIQLDEYQKNQSSPKIKNLKKHFSWENIEQDASRYRNNKEIIKANDSVSRIKGLMKDQRLVKRGQH
jgi:predicted RND superfamily exporter protein